MSFGWCLLQVKLCKRFPRQKGDSHRQAFRDMMSLSRGAKIFQQYAKAAQAILRMDDS